MIAHFWVQLLINKSIGITPYLCVPVIMSNYFVPSETCPNSKEPLLHSTVLTVRCGPCGLLNPQYAKAPFNRSERPRAQPATNQEVIEITESPVASTKLVSSANQHGVANHGVATMLPTVNNFKVHIISF